MIELACFLEDHYINIFSANLEIQMDAYINTAISFNIRKIKLIDLTQQKFGKYYLYATSELTFEHYDNFESFMSSIENDERNKYYIVQDTSYYDITYVNLFDVTHDDDCLYIIQPNFYKLDLKNYENTLKYLRPIPWDCFIFSQQLLSIVLYDRIAKQTYGV